MRTSHQENPLHRIEHWTGSHFRQAELWEVGTFLLIRHRTSLGESLCDNLKFQSDHIETYERNKDNTEQDNLRRQTPVPGEDVHMTYDDDDQEASNGVQEPSYEDELEEDNELDRQYFQQLWERDIRHNIDADQRGDDFGAEDPNIENDDGDDTDPTPPTSDGLNNPYVRVVHRNGIHHLPMVHCSCHGADSLPLDLVANRFMPCSFVRIRTLFSTQLLDYFRLSNLEMKCSAYQFYKLLQRITCSSAADTVVNLYHEFRRMSRIWRWMKKLKWAGYGHNGKDPQKPDAGGLANFCVACPQPGINLGEFWEADIDKYINARVFVADGNFKADHVRQAGSDLWLYDGGGMAPNQTEYFAFLKSAIETSTVSIDS